jgi:hypothetical protein
VPRFVFGEAETAKLDRDTKNRSHFGGSPEQNATEMKADEVYLWK